VTSLEAVESLLTGFFGPGNDLSIAALKQSTPEDAAWLEERLTELRRDPGGAHVLPRRVGGRTLWYGLAHSNRELRELAQILEALVVPSYARIIRQEALKASDPVDAAVIEFTGGHACVLEVLAGQQPHVRRSLKLFRQLEAQRPRRQLALSRPLGRLLREFEMAVLAGADSRSEELLREIEATGQLSTLNMVFLRIRRLAGLRRFEELLRLPELTTVLSIRRPARVSASLVEAVYATELALFESAGDAAGALRHFHGAVLQKYPALFKSRHGLQTPEAIKSFMLYALVVRPTDADLRAELVASPDVDTDDLRFLRELANLAGPQPPAERTLATAVAAARAGDYDAALRTAASQHASIERSELLIRCAFEIDSLDAMRLAASAVNDLDGDQRAALIGSKWYAAPWAHITEALAGGAGALLGEPPSTWSEWFQRVVAREAIPNAIQIAERAVVEWSVEQFSEEDSNVVAQLLNREMAPPVLRQVKDALPYFLQFLDRANERARYRQLLDDLTVFLLADDDLGIADVQVIVELVGTLLEIGMSARRYRQLIGDLRDLWDRVASPASFDAGIDMIDVVLTHACPDIGIRDSLLQAVIASFQRWRRRVRPDQWAMLADMAADAGWPDVSAMRPSDEEAENAVATPLRRALAGRTIAIYTLVESAGSRARDFLLRNFDDVTVEVSSEHVASDRLRTLARAADTFIVATRCAKHAATTFIEAQRPPDSPVCYAAGKGSASLIRALFTCLRLAGGAGVATNGALS